MDKDFIIQQGDTAKYHLTGERNRKRNIAVLPVVFVCAYFCLSAVQKRIDISLGMNIQYFKKELILINTVITPVSPLCGRGMTRW